MGYYAQEHEGITPGRSVIEHIREASGEGEQYLRSLLGMFGLRGELAFQDAGTLSGGEKTKLALAMLVAGRHNLLLLDEPTNNLDPPSRTAIGNALREWKGAMVLVSHDPEFVTELAPEPRAADARRRRRLLVGRPPRPRRARLSRARRGTGIPDTRVSPAYDPPDPGGGRHERTARFRRTRDRRIALVAGRVREQQQERVAAGGGGRDHARPAPRSCRRRSAPGVTADSIKLGISLIDFKCIQQFIDFTRPNQQAIYQAFIDDVNKKGGINGRKIVPDFNTECPLTPDERPARAGVHPVHRRRQGLRGHRQPQRRRAGRGDAHVYRQEAQDAGHDLPGDAGHVQRRCHPACSSSRGRRPSVRRRCSSSC